MIYIKGHIMCNCIPTILYNWNLTKLYIGILYIDMMKTLVNKQFQNMVIFVTPKIANGVTLQVLYLIL